MNAARTTLKVPFNEKDQAKALGARWNADLKQWYVPEGLDTSPFKQWITDTPSVMQQIDKVTTYSASVNQSSLDDIDTINAQLRDAYEERELDML